MKDRTSLE